MDSRYARVHDKQQTIVEDFLRLMNVVGVGIGYKVRAGEQTSELGIAVSVTEKMPASLKRLRRGQVKAVIGETFTLPVTEGKARGKQLKEFTELIMRRLADMLPEEYRGVYR